MNLSWMIYVLFVGGVLSVSAFAADSILRRLALPMRWLWITGLAAIVALALVAPQDDTVHLSTVDRRRIEQPTLQSTALPSSSFTMTLFRAQESIRSALSGMASIADARLSTSVQRAIAVAWVASSIVIFVVLLGVGRFVDGERRRWPVARIAGTRVRVAPSMGPAVVGLSSPEIVVPRWLLARTADEQRLVIVHEAEHVAAHDQLLMIGGLFVVALLPWHPAAWWMMSRLRLAIELDCDARVLKRGVQPLSYGALLIDIAGECAGQRVGALALADKPSHLERRLRAMKPIKSRFIAIRIATLGAVAALGIAAACEARLPTAAEVEVMDVAAAEKAATQLLLPKAGSGLYGYYVDGESVTETVARAMQGSKIAGISMMKPRGDVPGAVGRVDITSTQWKTSDPAKLAHLDNAIREVRDRIERTPASPSSKGPPLVVLDGVVATEGALERISSAEIEEVSVLKGKMAAAAYGTAGANGVIKVTTKHGAARAH